MNVLRRKHLSPEFGLATLDEVPSLLLEHRVLIGDSNKLIVTEAFSIRDVRQVRVALLAELSDNERLVELIRKCQHQL